MLLRYVKRELRSLTVNDREKFLDAASKMWIYNETEGKEIFGGNFTSIHTFVREHAIASGDIMCDQFHEGSGFLTHHLALTNAFEASMRAIDASVTLPYWDFTVEGQQIENLAEMPSYFLKITPVFSNTWFGEVDNNHVINSRWAHMPMPIVTDEDGRLDTPHNSYGYIRSYWNNNNAAEITRHLFDACGTEPTYKTIPTCQQHFDVLNLNTLGDFQLNCAGDGHGPMHVQFGGIFGGCISAIKSFTAKWELYLDANLTTIEIEATGQNAVTFIKKWGATGQRRAMFNKAIVGEYFHIYRSLWRSHMCAIDSSPALLVCPDNCDRITTPFEECTCTVDTLQSGEMHWYNLFPCVLNSASNQKYFNLTMNTSFMSELVTVLATSSVKEGEMLESASPADILFWLIHPVIERLLQAKRLTTLSAMGGVEFSKWVNVAKSSWRASSYYDLKEHQNAWHKSAYTCKVQITLNERLCR